MLHDLKKQLMVTAAVFIFNLTVLSAQKPDATFFESKIRPVLATKCYRCHASSLKAPMGGLILDTKAGLAKAIVPGKAAESRLLAAILYKDTRVQMPPTGKLPDAVIADFEQWIAAGAADPRIDQPMVSQSTGPLKGMAVEEGRKWWAFQALRQMRPKASIDSFVQAKLQEKGLTASALADARTLVRRVYIDLIGMKPTFEEVEAFAADTASDAYPKLIDKLLASDHYGEQWGRHWLDVARYAEDNPTTEATNPAYPFAWRYRDWVIEAINKDVPYDRFIKLQLAADQVPDVKREDLRALGYLGAAPVYHKDRRLSKEVISTFLSDDWDERVDAVSRGLLGMTVACARCHDHKFDPIPTKDYYGLASVFASTMAAERPLFAVDPKVEARFMWVQNRLFELAYSVSLLTGEASTVVGAEARVAKWKVEIQGLKTEMEALRVSYPQLVARLDKYWMTPEERKAAAAARRRPTSSNEPFMNVVYDAAQYVDGSDENYTWIEYKPGEPRDLPVFLHGNAATPDEPTSRHFLSVLAKGDTAFRNGSGRLELAERIFSDSAPLAARVIVNRVWGWHFGKPLVATASDFGVQGDKPTHPELLDHLAANFIAHGWSLKWLHREIMVSDAYRQSSRPRADGTKVDPTNQYLWRMNPRRMDIEAYRDSLLRAAGRLSERTYGLSEDLDGDTNVRRTIYGRISRGRVNNLLQLYDFPDAMQSSPGRDLTTSPLQQLFVMNSAFIQQQALAVTKLVEAEVDQKAKIDALYRRILSRNPSAQELDLALSYLANGKLQDYAQVLLSTNEEIFWP